MYIKSVSVLGLILAVILSVGVVFSGIAQDEALCDYTEVSTKLSEVSEQLADTTTSEPDAVVRDLSAYLSNFTVQCSGLVFSDEAGGRDVVLGPFDIPEGIYRATFTTEGYGIVRLTALEGECGEGSYYTPGLFGVSEGQAVEGSEVVAQSTGCSTLIEVSNTQSGWSLEFEKLK